MPDFTPVPDNRAVGTGNPPQDIDNIADELTAMGGTLNVFDASFAGGAKGDGTTDDTAAIQAALNAASPGQNVRVPPATYLFSASLTIPDGVGLIGLGNESYGVPLGNYGGGGLPVQGTILKAANPFTGSSGATGMLFMRKASGQGGGQRIENITIDGSGLPNGNNLHGILIQDNTACVTLSNVSVYGSGAKQIGGDGLHCVSTGGNPPDLLNIKWCHFSGCAGYGATLNGTADSYVSYSEATGNALGGWNVINGNNTRFTGCKAEGTTGAGNPGWLLTAGSGFTGILHLANCTSQGNDGSGFSFTGSGTGTYQVIACSSDDDGHNGGAGGGGFAGMQCTSFSGFVLASGFNVRPGSIPSPQYGISTTSHNVLAMDCGVISGTTAAFFEGGANATIVLGSGVVQQGKTPGGVFGTGADGGLTFDGSSTVAGLAPSSSVYTMTRDLQATYIVINSGVTVKTANYRIYCQGSCTNNGTLSNVGNNASGSTAGGATSAALTGGRAGGAGGTGVSGAGAAGTAANFGTAGGNGGAGTSGGAGSGGAATNSATIAQNNILQAPWALITNSAAYANTVQSIGFGAGGGGGGSDASSNAGGGGGGGGGVVVVFAGAFTNSATGTVTVAGGNGGNGAAGNAGGGGGGAGGLIAVYTRTPWSQSGTLTVAGGTKGNHVGTGSDGVAGGSGLSLNVVVA